MNGILLINKPKNITSRDVVNYISKKFNTKKVGHNGTLDPLAEGVLVITIGKYTKLNELLAGTEKEYVADVSLGVKTDTLDSTGKIIEEKEEFVDEAILRNTLDNFPRVYMQEVPKYSAVKINGKKLYEYAREGIDILLPTREVSIKSLELLSYEAHGFKIKTLVSKGTYIRSLIRDILYSMGKIGNMSGLIRTKQGNFSIDNCYTLEDIDNDNYEILKIKDVLNIPKIKVTSDLRKKIVNGVRLEGDYPDLVLFTDEDDNELAIYKKENNMMVVDIML
ncbi:MAG: tRNA pseudouridine(55) synthase TruB [Bacilli bacterium]|nr:tRNA pseudouridine(55) synthase TruB [Bacilli bacterium]